jgi:hypothetical protein
MEWSVARFHLSTAMHAFHGFFLLLKSSDHSPASGM